MKGCVLWKGAVNNRGYGVRTVDYKVWLAHRLAYALANLNENIVGKLILHRCDVKRCVNPKHLFVGTAKENTQDMINKGRGRWASGETSGKSKLTWSDVQEIRKAYEPWKHLGLPKKYGVSKSTIRSVATYKSWRSKVCVVR